MNFTLITEDGSTTFDKDATYSIRDNGVLVIIDGKKRWTYGSSGWLSIEDTIAEDGPALSRATADDR